VSWARAVVSCRVDHISLYVIVCMTLDVGIMGTLIRILYNRIGILYRRIGILYSRIGILYSRIGILYML
jgi:hypothetical protein